MISDEAFVWAWLPGRTEPVVAGRLAKAGPELVFNYGRSFLALADAAPLYEPELPLRSGSLPLLPGLTMPGCLRDAAPDAWGRRVIINRLAGRAGEDTNLAEPSELVYLLESGSDRTGALDFQASPSAYVPRMPSDASLDVLQTAADRVERGLPLPQDLATALQHGTSIGGARPKALLHGDEHKYIAKFSSSTDHYSVVKAEFIAMRLAALAGLDVAPVRLERSLGRDVLLVERFDRVATDVGWTRRAVVSALTLFGLDEMMARYASYETLAEIVRHRFVDCDRTLRELFGRLVFNILCSNTDDHARNHAAFVEGPNLVLTPAYDICPQSRVGNEATQGMLITGAHRLSRVTTCVDAAYHFHLTRAQGLQIARHQEAVIRDRWDQVCDEADLPPVERNLFMGRRFLNPWSLATAE